MGQKGAWPSPYTKVLNWCSVFEINHQ